MKQFSQLISKHAHILYRYTFSHHRDTFYHETDTFFLVLSVSFCNIVTFYFADDTFDLNILTNTCITFQCLHYVHKLNNYKLYQIDNVFLYPNVRDQVNLNFQQKLIKWKDNADIQKLFILSYYHVRILSHPKNMCHGFKCHQQNLKLSIYCTTN